MALNKFDTAILPLLGCLFSLTSVLQWQPSLYPVRNTNKGNLCDYIPSI